MNARVKRVWFAETGVGHLERVLDGKGKLQFVAAASIAAVGIIIDHQSHGPLEIVDL
tara:strand:- start:451 stop:621 length:171 start_codon:yes stop_codon:yes gene_type:complete